MENVTQALLIAAGILIGIIILSLGVYLINVMGSYAANTQSQIDSNQLAQFNQEFLNYNELSDLTMQDIITIKNYALNSNNEIANYNLAADRAEDNNDYIDVYYAESRAVAMSESEIAFILDESDEAMLKAEMERISNEGLEANRFTCRVLINNNTGRVNKIYFYAE